MISACIVVSKKHKEILLEEICFHPAIAYPIDALQTNKLIHKAFLISDSDDILNIGTRYGISTLKIKKIDNYFQVKKTIKKQFPETEKLLILSPFFPLIDKKDISISLKNFHELKMSNCKNEAIQIIDYKTRNKNGRLKKISDPKNISLSVKADLIMTEALIKNGYTQNHPIIKVPSFKIVNLPRKGKLNILFSSPYSFFPDNLRKKIETNFDTTYAFNADVQTVSKLLKKTDIWITATCPPYYIGKELLTKGKKLKLVATPSTGTNHIDINYLKQKKIKLLSIKESPVIENIFASSEFSFSLLLALVNKIPAASYAAKYGAWREKEHEFRSIELNGKTIGLVGYGRIGKKMARFADSFGMNVIAYDPFKKIKESYIKQEDTLESLLKKADIVSLHYHLNEETKNSFGKKQFDMMKSNAYFLNTARGELVDEMAMIEALKKRKINAAAVDVISDEHIQQKWNHPVIKYSRENDNLIVSPHIAGCTVDSESKAMEDLLSQVIKYIKS